jgi:Xaa-Pro aminopeptidase
MSNAISALSVGERDRRYSLLRARLRAREVDCVVVGGSSLFYLTNGVPGERHGLFPTDSWPPTVAIHDRNVVDLPPEALEEIQAWISDIRPGNDASPLIDRIRELQLARGVIGLVDSTKGFGGLSHGICVSLQEAFPSARFVDVSDVFAAARAIKSDEEIRLIGQANTVFDAAIEAVVRVARPGMTGRRVVQQAIGAMWEAGGDERSTVNLSCWPSPQRNHVLSQLSLSRTIEPGDAAILTGFAYQAGYGGHGDQQICFGPPSQLHREMFDALLGVRATVLRVVKPGATQHGLVAAYRAACKETGFEPSTQSQIHQYGIDVPEYPGPLFATTTADVDFTLHPGMVYSIAPALQTLDGHDTVIGGGSLVVTESGHRELGSRPMELLCIET